MGTKRFFVYCVASVLLLSTNLVWADTFVMDIRANAGAAQEYCARQAGCKVAAANAKEFPNGNTFVQFQTDISAGDFRLLVPAAMKGDALMEALIKLRTARTLNAASVTVIVLPVDPKADNGKAVKDESMSSELLKDFFRVAGATNIQYGERDTLTRDLTRQRLLRFPRPAHDQIERVVIGDGHPVLTKTIAGGLGLPVSQWDKLFAKYQGAAAAKVQVLYVSPVALPAVNQEFFRTLAQIFEAKNRGFDVTLITPYLPYARTDKMDQPGVSVTGRLIADLIETVGTDRVAFARLHAPQSQGFFSIPSLHVSGRDTINKFLADYKIDAVVSPDAGFQKDATLYADGLKVPVIVLNKQRDPKSGESTLKTMGDMDLKGKRLAVIDDETASGSTLGTAAEFLKSQGATAVVGVVTHLAGSADKAISNKALDLVVVTNTFPVGIADSERFKALSIGEELAAGLTRMLHCEPLLMKAQ